MSYLYNGAREYIEKMKNDNSGVAVVEVILILVVECYYRININTKWIGRIFIRCEIKDM